MVPREPDLYELAGRQCIWSQCARDAAYGVVAAVYHGVRGPGDDFSDGRAQLCAAACLTVTLPIRTGVLADVTHDTAPDVC